MVDRCAKGPRPNLPSAHVWDLHKPLTPPFDLLCSPSRSLSSRILRSTHTPPQIAFSGPEKAVAQGIPQIYSSNQRSLRATTMKTSTATAVVEPSVTMSRRQPTRQARTNPPRNATTAVRPLAGRGSLGGPQDDNGATSAAPGFFPAITHFTDSISVLPKEMIRHFTMLKEVDAKICGPEEVVKHLVNAALKTSVPTRKSSISHRSFGFNTQTNTKANPSAAGSIADMTTLRGHSQEGSIVHQEAPTPVDIAEYSRRQLFHQLRHVMSEQLPILDEKNHVMSTATDALERQLRRCDSSYIHIHKEVSEEARYGNIHHWAYMDRTAEKKGTTAGERTRREAAIANGLVAAAATTQEGELAALRSEARREAVAARKQRVQPVDSDFDDSRVAKKPTGHGKGRKAADVHAVSNGTGLGISTGQPSTGANPPSKRRKVEKPASAGLLGGLTMERSLSAVFGPAAGNVRGAAGSPRETPAAETAKKRGRAGTVTNGTGRRRQVKIPSNLNSKLTRTYFPELVQRPRPSIRRQWPRRLLLARSLSPQ